MIAMPKVWQILLFIGKRKCLATTSVKGTLFYLYKEVIPEGVVTKAVDQNATKLKKD